MPIRGFDQVGGRYQGLVARVFGQDELVPPGIILELAAPEWDVYKQVRRWASVAAIAANVGNVGHIEIFNPAAAPGQPGLVVVVTQAKVQNPTATDTFDLTIDGAAGAVPAANLPLDTALITLAGVSGQIMSVNRILNTTVGVSGLLIDRVTCSVTGLDLAFSCLPVILRPQHRVAVFCRTQNRALTVVFAGYERTMTADEAASDQ